MINVCWQCGIYRADKIIDPQGPWAICPECGFRHPFKRLPLFVIGGASGTGKSTLSNALLGSLDGFVVLDSDILWRPEFSPPERYEDYFELWLRLCKNIHQAGKPVVLFGAGLGVPANLESCVEKRYFAAIHPMALVCEDDILAERLRARPAWRDAGGEAFIQAQIEFNRWFKGQTPAIPSVDTTHVTVEETVSQVRAWLSAKTAANQILDGGASGL